MLWRDPNLLWLLLGVLGVAVVLIAALRRRGRQLRAFAEADLVARLAPDVAPVRRAWRAALRIAALALLVVALAGPKWGFHWEEVKREGIDLIVAIDTSRSMLATDVKPDRLERAKLAVMDLVQLLKGDRIGLVPFAGTAFLECPLTLDYAAFERSLRSVQVGLIPRGGTALARAIETSLDGFEAHEGRHEALILITDGEDHEGDVDKAAQAAAEHGVEIFTVGIGTEQGELIPVSGGGHGFVKDRKGQVVKSRLNEEVLQKIASTTGGAYVRGLGPALGLDEVFRDHIAKMEKRELKSSLERRYEDRFQIPLAFVLLALVVESLVGDRKPAPGARRRWWRWRRREPARAPRAAVALLVLMPFLVGWFDPPGDRAAEGNRFFDAKKYDQAVQKYGEGLVDAPDSPLLQFNMAAALYKQGKYDEAVKALGKVAAEGDAKWTDRVSYNLGNAYYRLGSNAETSDPQSAIASYEQALAAYKRSMAANPGDSDAKFNHEFVAEKLDELKKRLEEQKKKKEQEQNRSRINSRTRARISRSRISRSRIRSSRSRISSRRKISRTSNRSRISRIRSGSTAATAGRAAEPGARAATRAAAGCGCPAAGRAARPGGGPAAGRHRSHFRRRAEDGATAGGAGGARHGSRRGARPGGRPAAGGRGRRWRAGRGLVVRGRTFEGSAVPLSPQGFPLRFRQRFTRPIAARRRALLALAACVTACVALSLAGPAAAADISLVASVEPNPLTVGDSAVLTLEFSGSQDVPVPDLGNLDGLSAQYLGPSTQVSIVNGQVSASVSHRFRLVAQRAGQFRLGPFRVEYQGKTYTSNPVPLRVLTQAQASTAGGNLPRPSGVDQLRLAVVPQKTQAYVGERVPIQIKLYVGNVRVDDLQFPEMNSDAIVLDKLQQPARQNEILQGRRWQTLRFDTEMTALKPGEIDIPATMAMSVLVNRRGRGDPLFDQFFGQTERRQVQVRADPVHLTVRPLPEAGRPASFSGAVGQFDFTLSAKPTQVAVGDPVTVEMRVSGKGNLSGVEAPALPAGDRFRAYDPTHDKDKDAPDRRVFEQVVIPRRVDVKQLPPVSFSFFDPEAGAYRTITRGPIALDVKPAAAEAAPHVFASERPAEPAAAPAPVGRDIVYIKDVAGSLSPRGASFFERPWFFVLQLVPMAVFCALLFFVRRRERFAADPSLLRFRNAGREVRRSLAAIRARSSDPQQFYDGLAGAVSAYLAAKLGLPPGAVERERVLACLSRNGTSADLPQKVDEFFRIVEHIRYAPSGSAEEERERALQLARGIVDRLERSRSAAGRLAAGLMIVLLLSSSVVARAGGGPEAGSTARPDPHTGFFRGNTAYAEGRYGDAARAYEGVLEHGVESGPLHFNLGNAYFKSGRIGLAIAEYERARRLLPRDPDVRANLDYAEEVAKVPVDERPMWQRLAFPLALRMSAAELAVLATALWFALWIALAARLVLPRLGVALRRGCWVAGVLWAVVAVSLLFRFAELELRREVVVTRAGETAVRFEPAESGTEHFPVTEGTLLEVTERRDEWLQVRRGDGRRGWIPSQAVTPLRAPS